MFVTGHVCENLKHETLNMHFAQLNMFILQEYATVDFSNILLKIVFFFFFFIIIIIFMYIGSIFKIMPILNFSVKMKILCDFVVKLYRTKMKRIFNVCYSEPK